VFHVTAITMRKDILHHTVLHGGPQVRRNDASLIGALSSEARVWQTLKAGGFDIKDVHCPESATGLHICRVALQQKAAGDARRAIEALFKMPLMRLIYIVVPDVDVHSSEAMDWAQCTRFRGDRDIMVEGGHFALTMDPTNDAEGKMVKVGYDFTAPFDAPKKIDNILSFAPQIKPAAKKQSVKETLASGPKHFYQLMEAAGTTDGRAITLELDVMRAAKTVGRTPDGLWCLTTA
jgi:2,5-furandicarboxylate decarboxylase 1